MRTFDELVHRIRRQDSGPVRLVGVDGCGGAGKTTYAARLSHAAGGAPVVHTDDFATHDEPLQWWPRMLTQVVEPLLRGEPASYHPYDWVDRRLATDAHTVAPAPIVVIEGVGAARSAWRDRLTHAVWIDAPRDVRLRRGIARDGEELREFWREWMRAEDAYVADERPHLHADEVVDGDPTLPHDPETEYVALDSISGPR